MTPYAMGAVKGKQWVLTGYSIQSPGTSPTQGDWIIGWHPEAQRPTYLPARVVVLAIVGGFLFSEQSQKQHAQDEPDPVEIEGFKPELEEAPVLISTEPSLVETTRVKTRRPRPRRQQRKPSAQQQTSMLNGSKDDSAPDFFGRCLESALALLPGQIPQGPRRRRTQIVQLLGAH
jgi:hypothetical protein